MIPSSSSCGCECTESTSTPVTPTIGATGTAGCAGANVACITVVNGAVIGISDRTLPGISGATGSAGCSSYNVPCITVSNGAITAISDRSLNIGTVGPYNVPAAGDATSGQVVLGSDTRLTNSRTPTAHASTHGAAGSDPITIAQSQVTNLTTDLSAKAPLASPTFTGTPAAPTAAADTNTTQVATTAYVIGQASTSNPAALGTVSPGSSAKFSRGDHIHPRQITALGSEVSGLLPFANLTNATAGSVLLGRGSSGSGVFQEITLGTNLSMSGTTLNATAASAKYRADFTFVDYSAYTLGITLASHNNPFSDSADYTVFCTEFVPTNFSHGFWVVSCNGNTAGTVGFALEYTTANPPTSGWTSVTGSTLDVNNTTSAFKRVSSTVTIGGSPTLVFWRAIWKNTTSGDAALSFKNWTLSLWS